MAEAAPHQSATAREGQTIPSTGAARRYSLGMADIDLHSARHILFNYSNCDGIGEGTNFLVRRSGGAGAVLSSLRAEGISLLRPPIDGRCRD